MLSLHESAIFCHPYFIWAEFEPLYKRKKNLLINERSLGVSFKCEIRHSFSVSLRALMKGLREEIISSYILRLF